MWLTLIGTLLRYWIVTAVTAVASNPNYAKWFGPDVVKFLQDESTITIIIAGIINTAVLFWSFRSRIFEKLETLKGIARPRTTTAAEVKAEVRAESATVAGISIPSKEQMTAAFQMPIPIAKIDGH